jgi:Fe(3+) dicitrate transport protein
VLATDASFLDEITIVGERTDMHQITGEAQYIGEAQLKEQSYSDIQRILRQAPGFSCK